MKRDYSLKRDRGLGRPLQKEATRKGREIAPAPGAGQGRGHGAAEAERRKSARKPVQSAKQVAATPVRKKKAKGSGFTPPPFFSMQLGERNFLFGDVWVFRHWPGVVLMNAVGLLLVVVGKTSLQLYNGSHVFLLGILVIALLACGLMERGIALDRERGQVVRWRRFLFWKEKKIAPLSDVRNVRVEQTTIEKSKLLNPCAVILDMPPDKLRIFIGEFSSGVHVKTVMDKFLQGDEVEEEFQPESEFDPAKSILLCIVVGFILWSML